MPAKIGTSHPDRVTPIRIAVESQSGIQSRSGYQRRVPLKSVRTVIPTRLAAIERQISKNMDVPIDVSLPSPSFSR